MSQDTMHFSLGYPARAYRAVNAYTRERLTMHLRRRSQRPYRPPNGMTYYAKLNQLGLDVPACRHQKANL